MIEVDDWSNGRNNSKIPFTLPETIQSLDFSYDGGRVSVYINGEEVLKAFVGHDVSVSINNAAVPEEQ